MTEFLKQEYWSKSESFLLPLTGIAKSQKYKLQSYLFWKNYSIEDYYLTILLTHDNYDDFVRYCKRVIFSVLDKKGYLVESYDFGNQCVMVLNISEWALDIELFLKGKYSKMSKQAKDAITDYHVFYDRGTKIDIGILAIIEPNEQYETLNNMTPIEYVADTYKLPLQELKKLGEIGSIYDKEKETLTGLKQECDHYLQQEGSSFG